MAQEDSTVFSNMTAQYVLNNLRDSIIVVGTSGKILYYNFQANKHLRLHNTYLLKDVIARNHIKDEDGREVTASDLFQEELERVIYTHDNFWYELSSQNIELSNERVYIIRLNDITYKKKKEMQYNVFLATADHDVKSILTSIKAYLQLLNKKIQKMTDMSVVEEYIEKVEKQLNKLIELLTDIAEANRIYAKKVDLNLEEYAIDTLVTEVLSTFSSQERTIVVSGKITQQLLLDVAKMKRVIRHVISNALKFSPEGTTVEVLLKEKEGTISITVNDKGIGISPEDLPYIFEPLYIRNTKRTSQTGLGIGLFLSRAIVNAHNGTVFMTSEVQKGSSITITMPTER